MSLFKPLYPHVLSGRVRYKFASFWNRNHALRGLQRAVKNYHDMLEAEKKVWTLLLLHLCALLHNIREVKPFALELLAWLYVNVSKCGFWPILSWYILKLLCIRTLLLDFQQNTTCMVLISYRKIYYTFPKCSG